MFLVTPSRLLLKCLTFLFKNANLPFIACKATEVVGGFFLKRKDPRLYFKWGVVGAYVDLVMRVCTLVYQQQMQ